MGISLKDNNRSTKFSTTSSRNKSKIWTCYTHQKFYGGTNMKMNVDMFFSVWNVKHLDQYRNTVDKNLS